MMNEPTKVIDKLYIGNEKSFKCKRHFDGIVSVMVNPPSTKVNLNYFKTSIFFHMAMLVLIPISGL